MTFALVVFPYARLEGLGRAVKDNAGQQQLILATMIALLTSLVVAWCWADWRALLAFTAAILTAWVGVKYTLSRIPGLTGDIYGALNEIVEVAVLLVMASASLN
jgi:adenosylcobinamide-GDP ribazoletransferase